MAQIYEDDRTECSFSGRQCIKYEKDLDGGESDASYDSNADFLGDEIMMTEVVPEGNRIKRLKEIQPAFTEEGEEPFQSLTKLVRATFNIPIVLVSLVYDDFQWFKAGVGLYVNSTPRCAGFCAHTFIPLHPEVLYVPNALKDDRFSSNPLVLGPPYIRFYCGVPLLTPDHIRLGALCMIEDRPRSINVEGMRLMINIAELTVRELLKSNPGRKVYMEKLSAMGRMGRIRKMPSLLRANVIRELWFGNVDAEGVVIVSAKSDDWRVLWSNPVWPLITKTRPLEQQSLWSVASLQGGESHQETHKYVMEALSSGNAHVRLVMQTRSPEGDVSTISCKVCFAHSFMNMATRLINVVDKFPAADEIPITVPEGCLLVFRATLMTKRQVEEYNKVQSKNRWTASSKYPSDPQESLANDIEDFLQAVNGWATCSEGRIPVDQLLKLVEKVRPDDGTEIGKLLLDESGLVQDGTVPCQDFFRWLFEALL